MLARKMKFSKDMLDDPSMTKAHLKEIERKIVKAYKATRSKTMSVLMDYANLSEFEKSLAMKHIEILVHAIESEHRKEMRMWIGLMLMLANMRYEQYTTMFLPQTPYTPETMRGYPNGVQSKLDPLFRERAETLTSTNFQNLQSDLHVILSDAKIKPTSAKNLRMEIDKAFNKSERHMRMIALTEMMYVFNTTVIERAKLDGYTHMMWVTANDERVCNVCGGRHTAIFPINSFPDIPAHPLCRCVAIPVR